MLRSDNPWSSASTQPRNPAGSASRPKVALYIRHTIPACEVAEVSQEPSIIRTCSMPLSWSIVPRPARVPVPATLPTR
jgi:hypothetical protein